MARKAAAPTIVTKATAATHQARWIRAGRRTGFPGRGAGHRLGGRLRVESLCHAIELPAWTGPERVARRTDSLGSGHGRLSRRARSSPPRRRPRRDGLLPFELGIPHRIFGSARDQPRSEPLYEVVTCAVRRRARSARTPTSPSRSSTAPRRWPSADTVIVPAVVRTRRRSSEAGRADRRLAAALAHIRPGTRLASICTGAFVLAAAGLLDGRARHHALGRCRALPAALPAGPVDPDVLFIDDGDVLTSAGRRRRDRPVPAHGAPRPRRRRRQRGGPPHGRAAAPRRRPGPVHPAPRARTRSWRTTGHGPRLGPGPPRTSRSSCATWPSRSP